LAKLFASPIEINQTSISTTREY